MRNPGELAIRLAATLHRIFWLAPRGYGKPVSLQTWERQYQMGAWDFLGSLQELGHYMVIVGYATQVLERPDILDVGCGHGVLLRLLPASSFRTYWGVDFSREAISRANGMRLHAARFVRADFENWVPPQPMDIIVFNESLYNSRRPAELVEQYCQYLKPNGKIIISMFKARGDRFIWKKLDSVLHRVDGMCIVHDRGQTWQIGLFARRPDSR